MNNEPLYNQQLSYKTFSVQLINENHMYFFQLLGTLIWFCDFIIAYFLYLSITFFRKIKYSEFSVNFSL